MSSDDPFAELFGSPAKKPEPKPEAPKEAPKPAPKQEPVDPFAAPSVPTQAKQPPSPPTPVIDPFAPVAPSPRGGNGAATETAKPVPVVQQTQPTGQSQAAKTVAPETVLNSAPAAPSGLDSEFTMEEAKSRAQQVITLYGTKGSSKTSSAFSFPGTIACISFDRKSEPVKKNMYNNDPRIKVYDGLQYMPKETVPDIEYYMGVEKSYNYILYVLDQLALNPPDWVILDCTEVLWKMAQMLMRSRNNIPRIGGVNRLFWQQRLWFMDTIHEKALLACKRGVIYTAYVKVIEGETREGEVMERHEAPSWVGSMLRETDITIRVRAITEKEKIRFTARIDNSKNPMFKTGQVLDITDKKLGDFIAPSIK